MEDTKYDPNRDKALAFALESFRQNETPPGADAIVERAKAFASFLDADT